MYIAQAVNGKLSFFIIIRIYVFNKAKINLFLGTRAEKIHTVPKSHDELPLQLSDGEITYLISGGKITTLDIADAGTDTSNGNNK